MFLTYIWQPANISFDIALEVFKQTLNKQSALYAKAWGATPSLRICYCNDTIIGQLAYETGIKGWTSWVIKRDLGVVWGGVCETYLGCNDNDSTVKDIIRILHNRPNEVCTWDGRFFVISWKNQGADQVLLTSGATESPSLWYTEGPRGWAVGSRASPLLDLVDRKRIPSILDMKLFLTIGYLPGTGALFSGVKRILSRRQITFRRAKPPLVNSYASIAECIRLEKTSRINFSEATEYAAERITQRVHKQLQHSVQPVVQLTGGRDSRCIAAAAHRCGFSGPYHTGGNTTSPDVRIAATVCNKLRIHHLRDDNDDENNHGYKSPIAPIVDKVEELQLWTNMSEGIETIRHAIVYPWFFQRQIPHLSQRIPIFHGMAGEIGRGVRYKSVPLFRRLNSNSIAAGRNIIIAENLKLARRKDNELREYVQNILEEFDNDIEYSPSIAQWLDLYFWQVGILRWGEDMMSAKSPIAWRWTPLQDRQLIQVILHLRAQDKRNNRFIEAITTQLAPSIEEVAYDLHTSFYRERIKSNVERWLSKIGISARAYPFRYRFNRQENKDPFISLFWDMIFFRTAPNIWNQFVDENTLRDIALTKPQSELLWNAATIELFAMTHL